MFSLQQELASPLFGNKKEMEASGDYRELERLLELLTRTKEDSQQRNWMLYEDESFILANLATLGQTLQNASQDVCLLVLARFQYHYVQSLVEYYQMETRWTIRRLLIETYTVMCSLDPAIISLMLVSVLPLELAQDMFENAGDEERLRHSAVLLTILFSQGEAVPVHYSEQQLGESLVSFLLDRVEQAASDADPGLADSFLGLLASYNLQFPHQPDNIVLQCLARASSAKIFTEKLLLLLNREEDPAELLRPRPPGLPSSTHKLVLDVFSCPDCAAHFYTNDMMVLLDITARQLADLPPGQERYFYLELVQLVLGRPEYSEHRHRERDLRDCLHRIRDREEAESIDRTKAAEICQAFPALQ